MRAWSRRGSTDRAGALAVLVALALLLPPDATAETRPAPYGPHLLDGSPVGGSPRPWLDFCATDPARHRCFESPAAVTLDERRMSELRVVQDVVSTMTLERSETSLDDEWRLLAPGDAGDCEDMALAKRDELMALGWPAGALRPAFCYSREQSSYGPEMHAVLTVETDGGTYVLGNLASEVTLWHRSECRDWVMRAGPAGWRWIAGGVTAPIRPVAGSAGP